MADLEESEFGDGERVRLWLTRATAAPIDKHWRCQPCGMVTERWQSVCPNCGAFGTIDWRSPPPGYSGILSLDDGISAEEVKAITVERPPVADRAGTDRRTATARPKAADDKPLPPPATAHRSAGVTAATICSLLALNASPPAAGISARRWRCVRGSSSIGTWPRSL